MLLADVVATAEALSATRARRRKTELLAALLGRLGPDERAIAVGYLAGEPRQRRLDVGPATLFAVEATPTRAPTLEVLDVHRAFEELTAIGGPGSRQARLDTLASLLSRATEAEQRYLRRLILGDLRQGALAGVVTQAVAAAAGVDEAAVRRAVMLSADLGDVAQAAFTGGVAALARFRLELFRPVQPMLASTASSAAEAVTDLGAVAVEDKLDGARIQVHRAGERVRVYSRTQRDITSDVSGVVEAVLAYALDTAVLDGEVIGLRADGRPLAFQDTMKGLGTRRGSAAPTATAGDTPAVRLTPFFFDVLHLDGRDLLDEPLRLRSDALERAVPQHHRIGRTLTDDPGRAEQHYQRAVAAGFEGVVVKRLAAPYEAGRRGATWRKVKPAHALDLVVLAAEWGSGRRKGWLSNLHLGARADDGAGFVMLGKTFKGLTDELLTWQTEQLLAREIRREGHVVHVRPELVVEIAIDGVQTSTRYPAGMALRFARVKRYRDDKRPGEADTVATVRALHARTA